MFEFMCILDWAGTGLCSKLENIAEPTYKDTAIVLSLQNVGSFQNNLNYKLFQTWCFNTTQGNYGLYTFVTFSSLTQLVAVSYNLRSKMMFMIHVFRRLLNLILLVVSIVDELSRSNTSHSHTHEQSTFNKYVSVIAPSSQL